MSNCLHLAIPAGDLEKAKAFYCDVLGCKTGNSEAGRWVDIDFWGNELTLHQSTEREFQALKTRIAAAGLEYLDKPYRRFVGDEFEQETFFIEDPNGNVLEMKTMVNPEVLFKKGE